MPSNFLRSHVLPGTPIPHHEHRRLLMLLVVVIIVAIVIGLIFWSTKPAIQDYTPYQLSSTELTEAQMRQQIVNQLESSNSSPDTQTITNTSIQLKKTRTKLTDTQRAAIVKQLSEI